MLYIFLHKAADCIRKELPRPFYGYVGQLGAGHGKVPAAAQRFHNQLDVDVAQASGRNIHGIPCGKQHKRCGHPFNGQQLVRCLRRRHADIGGILFRGGNGALVDHLRAGDNAVAQNSLCPA